MSRLVSGSVAWRRMLRTIRVVRSQLIAELCKKVVQTVQKGGGASIMPTAKECRLEAKAFLELADQANEFYVKTALIELARDYNRARAPSRTPGTRQGCRFQSSGAFAIGPPYRLSFPSGAVPTVASQGLQVATVMRAQEWDLQFHLDSLSLNVFCSSRY